MAKFLWHCICKNSENCNSKVMKKIIFTVLLSVMGLLGVQAQSGSFEVGPYLGAPVGDADGLSFNAGATFAYYFEVIPRLKVGGLIGVDHFFGKDYDWGDVTYESDGATFIPIAASAKFNITDKFFAGLDLGYAIGVSDGAGDGGFMARPRVGLSLPIVDVYGFYKNINYSWDGPGDPDNWDDGFNVGSIGVGAAFKF